MAEQGVGAVDGATVDSTQGQINAAPLIELQDYLQGGLAGLKGSWNVTASGLIDYGTYPDVAALSAGATYWEYQAVPTPTWTQLTK
jgi:hypothetical protein